MAKVKYGISTDSEYYGELFDLTISKSGKVATWTYGTDATVVLTGSKLKEGVDESLGGGTVNSVKFIDPEHHTLVSVTDLDLKATKLQKIYQEQGFAQFQLALISGNDRITGSKFDDHLDGYLGNDTFTGGGGADTFAFFSASKPEHDVITDFTLYVDTLELHLDIASTTSRNKGEDTLISFDGGSDVLLKHVEKADFDNWYYGSPE